ncbi:hypothetical protein [Lysobacter panacisoli]|nr:hypothetical protein [Lysobacter panacisoli]
MVDEARAAGAAFGFGNALAMLLSWSVNRSVLWALVHGFLSWVYVIHYMLVHAGKRPDAKAPR